MEYNTPPHTPTRKPRRQEATTRKKAKFYEVAGTRERGITLKDLCIARNIPYGTAKKWLRLRKLEGSPGTKRHGKYRSGRPSKVNQAVYDTLRDTNNPVRNQTMERQVKHHQILVYPRIIRRNSHKYTKNAYMYKQRPAKEISELNAEKRLEYGHTHQHDTIEDYWQFVA